MMAAGSEATVPGSLTTQGPFGYRVALFNT